MGFNLNGYVLRPARLASGNSPDSNEAVTGVDRDFIQPDTMKDLGYEELMVPAEPVEPYGDMYRAAVLEKPESRQGTEEYCVFAASTGSLSTVEDPAMAIIGDSETADPIADTLSVDGGAYEDGTLSFYIRDAGQRDITEALTIVIIRGDAAPPIPITLDLVNVDPTIGKVTVSDPSDELGGGFSEDRGDHVYGTSYVLGSPTFWWTRNDPDMTRFGWDGKISRWLPLLGGGATNMGSVKPEESYKLVPPPSRFEISDTLPGSSSEPEGYALVRCGLYADADSTPLDIFVVSNTDAQTGTWDAAWDAYEAVVGVSNGVLLLNPDFITNEAGRTLWYNAETHQSDANGDMGAMVDFPTGSNQGFPAMSPVPEPTARPFLRIGSRRYLTPIAVDQDTADPILGLTGLPAPSAVPTESFYWSKATGKIVLSDIDIAKCVPGSETPTDPADYEIPFLGAHLYYDGSALNSQPIPIKAPVAALNADGEPLDGTTASVAMMGKVWVPRAVCLPPPGVSGVRWEEDGTGTTPTLVAITADPPQTRPNGSGLVRRISGGATTRIYGDTFLFSKEHAYENLDVIEYDEDLKIHRFQVPKNEVEIARMTDSAVQPSGETNASRIQFRRRPVRGEALYFRSAEVIPSVYADEARIWSRFQEQYTLDGTETIRFALDGAISEWSAGALNPSGIAADYSADDVATSLINDSVPPLAPGAAEVFRGRIYLRAADTSTGSVEIGWNEDQTDLSGHAALGFLPGWRVDMDDAEDRFRWLPDNGAYMGVFRSPVNMDRTASTPDIRAVSRFNDTLLTTSIPANPFLTMSPSPLLDIPGYTATSHFQVVVGLLTIEMENYQTTLNVGVVYDWSNDRLIWCEEGTTGGTQVPFPTSTLQLSDHSIFPETVDPLAMDDSSFGLRLRRATDTIGQTLPADFSVPEDLTGADVTIDFLMPGDGGPGQAVLVTPEGEEVAAGGKGTVPVSLTHFYDPNVSDQAELYSAVEVGYLLHILGGDNEGIYTITLKENTDPAVFSVTPDFAAEESSAQWRIYKAKERSAVDMTLLADVQQVVTNHLPDEPFKVRLLTSTGTVEVGHAPLNANVVDAIASSRIVSLRFGLDAGSPEAVPAYLEAGVNLGSVVASGLVCPDLTDPHLTLSDPVSYFQIRVGAMPFSTATGNMTLNTGSVNVGDIDVNTTTGEILVGDDVMSELTGNTVYYDQLFLDPSDLTAGSCEINPLNGEINIAASDATLYDGVTAYFVEQMVTEDGQDATINPMNGSLLFSKPLREWQIVEVNYFQADTDGDKAVDDDGTYIEITEFLPLMVTLEVATYISDLTPNQWSFNPTSRTVSDAVEEFIWVGTNLMNFAGVENATAIDGIITVSEEWATKLETDSSTEVKINYGVLEAFGGEQAYTVSTPPVYRKPFWIEADSSTFTLETDRTADFLTGLLMVLGPTPLYIESSTYDAGTDLTTVAIFPTPEREVGSRAPGRDAGLTLSDFLVSVSRGGGAGFMPLLDTAVTPLLECDKDQVEVAFYGDVRRYTKTGHLLEIGGYPYLIVASDMSEDGYNTIVKVGTPLYKAHDNSEEVRVSVRRVYLPVPVEFTGISPFLPSEEYDLFLMGRADSSGTALPGKALIEGMDYTVDAETGNVVFQHPTQPALQPGQYLHFRYTRLISVGPTVDAGAILYPVYRGRYLYTTTPSTDNRLLGAVLKSQYTYRNQDSFYYSVQMLEEYLGEISTASASQGVIPYSGGPAFFTSGEEDISKKGSFGLRGGAADASDQDRGARVFVEFFNGVVLAFEQVLEAIDGRIIGDRDGKFRFFIGHDKRYAPPGYQDAITGNLNQRVIWRDVIEAWAPASFESDGGYFRTKDPIYLPITAEVPDPTNRPGDTDGMAMWPNLFNYFTEMQRTYIKNDMDDRLLVSLKGPTFLAALFPTIDLRGNFDDMWEDHRFSRLFPTETEHFSRLFPGINYDPTTMYEGFYTPGRDIEVPGPEPGETSEQTVKTTGSPNGVVANNALGKIPNIVEVNVQPRLPRGRVWAYYSNGSTELDTALGTSTVGYATIVATPLTLGDFPIDPDTGFPDVSDMMTLANPTGTVYSLESGNPDLATPAFEVGQRVNYGKPDGATYSLKDSDGNGIYVESVLEGCVLILGTTDDGGVTFTKVSGNLVFVDEDSTERLSTVISEDDGYADTVFIGTGSGVVWDDGVDTATAEKMAELQAALAQAIPDYRIQFDLGVGKLQGDLIDRTLPTAEDNFFLPIQDMFGQKPPDPLSCVEGDVQFINTDSEPLKLPCLLGEDKDDSGDNQIPFMKGFPNELAVLGQLAPLLEGIYVDTGFALPYGPVYYGMPISANERQDFASVYPDEMFVGDGALYEEATYVGYPQNPATLYTDKILDKATDEGLPANEGLGDLRRFDLLFSQVAQSAEGLGLWLGATGILDVGDVVYDVVANGGGDPSGMATIEVPRFVAPTTKGELHRYTLRGFAARVEETEGGNEGFIVQPSTPLPSPQYATVLDFSGVTDMPDLSLLDNLINGVPLPPPMAGTDRNALVIRIYDPSDTAGAAFIGAITIVSGTGGFGPLSTIYFYNHSTTTVTTAVPVVAAVFDPDQITIRYDMSLTPTPADPVETVLGLTTGQPYDFRLDVDTYGDSETAAVTNAILAAALYGSTTCTVLRDRLTFTEEIDPTMAKPRDYLPANGEAIELGAALNVWEFAGGFTVNECTEINNGEYLTFLNRYNTDPVFYVGTYDGTNGALRAMSWEGHGNEVLSAEITGVTLSAASSSDLQDTVGGGGDWIISSGSYNFWDGDSDVTPVLSPSGFQPLAVLIGNRNYLLPTTTAASNGDISNIMRNDICVVTGASNSTTGSADAVKTGTYLVRHAVKAGPFNTDPNGQLGETAMLDARQYDDVAAPLPTAQASGPSADTDDGAGTGSSGGDSLSETNCLDLTFPTVTGYDLGAATLSIKGVVPVMRSADPALAGDNHGWETSGDRLYLVLKEQYATYSDDAGGVGVPGWIVDGDSVWGVDYTSILSYDAEEGTMTFQLDNTGLTERNAVGSSLSLADFLAAAVEGTKVSGMIYFAVKQMGSHLPENNVVGAELRQPAHDLMAGFEYVTVGNRNPNMINPYLVAGLIHGWGDDIMYSFQAGGDLVHNQGAVSPAINHLVAGVPDPVDNTEFYEDRTTPVYGMMVDQAGSHQDPIFGVCTYLQTNHWSSGVWLLSHYGGFAVSLAIYDDAENPITPETSCLLPSDRFTIGSEIDPASATASAGFYALSGVFIEPSFPRPVQDISTPFPKVTTASYDDQGGVSQIGARDFEDFGGADPYEDVYAAIRRTRRWHDIQVDIIDLVKPLRFVYEIRRGFMSSYDTATRTLIAATGVYGTATNLGEFNNDDVNIHSGDVVRVLDDNGDVLDTAEIQRVEDETTLILRRPGLTNENIVGDEEFEVYIEQAIVPHQQSNEQLLDLVTQEVVFTRRVDYDPLHVGTEVGGFVDATNELKDSDPSVTSWENEGVLKDDYIIIDPAGDLYKELEAGARPSGDMSVVTRPGPAGPYLEGGPSKLDDNRGFYKITAVDEDSGGAAPGTLMVSGETRFTDGELFGDGASVSEYVVMPTIHGSWLTEPVGVDGTGVEDQQDLRLTAGPVGDSYYDRPTATWGDDGYKSIGPFAYKIIRPNSIFSQDTVELILFIRERMLSWIDEINVLWPKSGDYYVFQRDDHIEDVGSSTDTTAGLGILSNLVVDSLKGLTDDTPFANMSDCLSVLDRRFWCLDYRLDNDGYTQFATGDYSQRPVEPDLIDAVLDTDDLFRNQRYGWITFRANTTDGSIRNATREKRTLTSRLQKQREALIRQKGLDKA